MPEVSTYERFQEIVEQLSSGLNLDPQFVREYFVSNMVSRVLSYLLGWSVDTGNPVKLISTPRGELIVSVSGYGFIHNESFSGSVGNDWETVASFSAIVGRVDLWISDDHVEIRRSLDGVLYDEPIRLDKGSFYSFDCQTLRIEMRSLTSGVTAGYRIVGWR